MHESVFSYNLTRPYPFRWYTWIVVLGGITATALFSILNLAAYGYDATIVYVSNPNETEHPSTPAWYQRKPWSLASKVHTLCQSVTFELGSQFYTNTTYLRYEVTSIQRQHETQSLSSVNSFAYHNDLFHDCTIDWLAIVIGYEERTSNNIVDATVMLHCVIYVAQNPFVVGLAFTLSDMEKNYPFYPTVDNKTQPALFWANLLLFMNGTFLEQRNATVDDATTMVNASIVTWESNSPRGQEFATIHRRFQVNTGSVSDPNLLWAFYDNFPNRNSSSEDFYIQSTPTNWTKTVGLDVLNQTDSESFDVTINSTFNPSKPEDFDPMSYAVLRMDFMAKILYSAVMTDFGQRVASNIFVEESGLPNQLRAIRPFWTDKVLFFGWYSNWQIGEQLCSFPFNDSERLQPKAFYEHMGTGIPRVDPAVINAQYLCQVPKLKPIGSLLVSVVVADLVLLQALWVVFNWVVRLFLERQDSQANYCEGCGKSTKHTEFHMKGSPLPYSFVSSDTELQNVPPVTPEPVIRRRPVGGPSRSAAKTEPETNVRLLSEPQ